MSAARPALHAMALIGALATSLVGCREHVTFDAADPAAEPGTTVERLRWDERPQQCVMEGPALSPSAEWEGMSADRAFATSRSRRLRLKMPKDEDDEGWVLFGDANALSPPAQGEACYPSCAFARSLQGGIPTPLEGFIYPVRLTKSDRPEYQRLEFDLHAPWATWCQQQSPVRLQQAYVCAPRDLVTVEDGECVDQKSGEMGALEDCCREILCNQVQVCRCGPGGCEASEARGYLYVAELIFPEVNVMVVQLGSGGTFVMMERDAYTPLDGGTDPGPIEDGGRPDRPPSLI